MSFQYIPVSLFIVSRESHLFHFSLIPVDGQRGRVSNTVVKVNGGGTSSSTLCNLNSVVMVLSFTPLGSRQLLIWLLLHALLTQKSSY
jgi:hypothetical protein